MINPFDIVSGKVVQNENGTFYFIGPGNNMRSRSAPIYERLHKEDGPAIIWCYGGKEWYINGEQRLEDGSIYKGITGVKGWWLNGKH